MRVLVALTTLLAASLQAPPPDVKPAVSEVVSVDRDTRTVTVKTASGPQTVVLAPECAAALPLLAPGQQVQFAAQDHGAAAGFVITGPGAPEAAPSPAQAAPDLVPSVPAPSTSTRQGKVLAVDQPGKRLVVSSGSDPAAILTLEGMGARSIKMIDPGEEVLLYMRTPTVAVAFVITGWPLRS